MRSFEIKVYPEFLTGHIVCDHATALDMINWIEESAVRLYKTGALDFDGNPVPFDTAHWRKRIAGEARNPVYGGLTSFWFTGHLDEALLLKMRWHDHFSEPNQ
jgi:hypothetical protein